MELDAALEWLTGSGLISRRGTPPDATYSFKHALVQDAAYATMLRSRRRQLHASIAPVLLERFAAMAESLPESSPTISPRPDLPAKRSTIGSRRAACHARSAGREAANRSSRRCVFSRRCRRPPSGCSSIDLYFDLRGALLPLAEFEQIRLSSRSRSPGECAQRSTAARPDIRLSVPPPQYDRSSGGSTRVWTERPGPRRGAWGCPAADEG